MKSLFSTYALILTLGVIFWASQEGSPSAIETVPAVVSTLDLVIGDIQTVHAKNLTRVSVTNPDIADISDADDTKVSLLAKNAGDTILFMWDASGKRTINIRVVKEDLHVVEDHIQKLLDEAGIKGVSLQINDDEGKVALTGSLSKDNRRRLDTVVNRYNESILNFVREENDHSLVQVDMEIVEISTSLEKNLGIQWGIGGSGSGTSANNGTASGSLATTGSAGVALSYGEKLPVQHTFGDLFKIGHFSRSTTLSTTVNALINEGKAKLISKPRLVVVSGKQASFLVGGEIPILNTTSNSIGTTQTTSVTFAQYGVNLSVSPTIREGKIDVVLNVDIRDIDASNSSGGNPAFITRTASTDLLMDNKQTMVLAGLIKYAGALQVTKVPFLSNIPIIGNLFTNRAMPTPDTKTEMVIILTPVVLNNEKFVDTQMVMPTPREREAWQGVDSNYEHESFNPPPAPSAPPAARPGVIHSPSVVMAKSLVKALPEAVPAPVAKPATVPQAKPAPSQEETVRYARGVQQEISAQVGFPQEAIDNRWVGTVKLKLRILKSGTLASVDVLESSGHTVFDENALRAAHMAAPYAPFTAGMTQDELTVTLPIIYSHK